MSTHSKVTLSPQNHGSQGNESDGPTYIHLILVENLNTSIAWLVSIYFRTCSGDWLWPLAFSYCDLPFFILCEINLWLRFISLKEAGVDEILLIYCIEHTSSQREKMRNWNDKVVLLACCWGNWSGLCCAVLWWVEIKYVRIYLDHTSEERDDKIYPLSIYVLRKSPKPFLTVTLKQNENKIHSEWDPEVRPALCYPWKYAKGKHRSLKYENNVKKVFCLLGETTAPYNFFLTKLK